MISIISRGALVALAAEREGEGEFQVSAAVVVRILAEEISVPAGFVTDGASVPWWARWRFDPWGRAGVPSIVHDWLVTHRDGRPKWLIDWIFFGLLKAEGVPDLAAALMFLAVRTRP